MKIHLFKQIEYKPVPITSLASNETNIFIFRSNKTLEILDKLTLQKNSILFINYIITKSLRHQNFLVCISDLDEIIFINLLDFSIKTNKIGYKITDCIILDTKIFLSTYNGFLLEVEDDNILIRFKSNSLLSCLVYHNDYFIIGGSNKLYILSSDFSVRNEMEIVQGLVTSISYISDDKYGLITDKGCFIYLDIKIANILQSIQVRSSSLNVLLFNSGYFYTSGDDSRLVCYKLIKDSFIKLYQVDLHYGISKCILWDNLRIFVGNTDGILSCLVPDTDKFLYMKIYDRNLEANIYESKILINNKSSLDLFYLDEGNKIGKKNHILLEKNLISDSCTFKLKKEFLKDSSVKNLPYRNLLKITGNEYITSSNLFKNKIIFSDNKETKIIEFDILKKNDNKKDCDNKNNLNSKLKIYNPSLNEYLKDIKAIFISQNINNYIIQDNKNNIHIINKVYTDKIKKIDCDNKINIMDNKIINMSTGKLIIGTNHINLQEDEVLIFCIDKEIYLTQIKDFNILKRYRIYYKNKLKEEIKIYDVIIKLFMHQNEIWYSTQSYIYNLERKSKFDFGSVIYDVLLINGNILVIKDDWNYIKSFIEKGIFKKKYSIK